MECKQYRPRSDCSFRCSLIWVYTVCICYFDRGFCVRNFRTFTCTMYLFCLCNYLMPWECCDWCWQLFLLLVITICDSSIYFYCFSAYKVRIKCNSKTGFLGNIKVKYYFFYMKKFSRKAHPDIKSQKRWTECCLFGNPYQNYSGCKLKNLNSPVTPYHHYKGCRI